MKKNIFDTFLSTTIKLPLRRSIQVSLRNSAIASQFTQSEAKGHSLLRPVILLSTLELTT